LAQAADDRLSLSRPGSRIPSGPAARIPPSWAAGLFRAPLRSRAGRNGPKGAWTGPGPSETMRDRGGRADLGGGVGPSSCSRTALLTTPVPCRRASSFRLTENSPLPKFAYTAFSEVRMAPVQSPKSPPHSIRRFFPIILHERQVPLLGLGPIGAGRRGVYRTSLIYVPVVGEDCCAGDRLFAPRTRPERPTPHCRRTHHSHAGQPKGRGASRRRCWCCSL
jgi:hypothetical protein